MAQAILLNGGGMVDSESLTATARDVLSGYEYIGFDTDGDVGIGILEFTGNAQLSNVLDTLTFYNNDTVRKTGSLTFSGKISIIACSKWCLIINI